MDIANLQIKADSRQVETATKSLKGLEGQSRKTQGSVKNLGNAAKRGSADFGILEKSIFSIKNLIGTVLVGATVSFADEMKNLTARIKNSTESTAEFEQAFRGLSSAVAETGASFASAVEVFQRLSFTRKEIAATVEEMVQFTATVQKLGIVSGASTGALSAGLTQLGQALSSDVTRAEEFNSILENIPAVAVAIADEFGVTTGQLRQLVIEGEVLSKDVFAAVLNQTEKANEQFDKMPLTIGRATSQLINQFKILVAGIDESTGATEIFAGFIVKITEAVKGLQFLVVASIKAVDSLITLALSGIFSLLNSAIDGLNAFGDAAASVFNKISSGVSKISFGKIDLGQREGREFQRFLPETEFLNEAATERILQNANDVALTVTDLFGEQEKAKSSTRELSKNYVELAASLKDAEDKTESTARKTENANTKFKESQSALQQYGEEARNVTDQLQDMGVRGIKSLEDNLVGLIRGTVSVADAFRSMADQIIDDLIRIQVRKSITEPLSGVLDSFLPSIGSALFGGGISTGGGGSITSSGIPIPGVKPTGFASGGSFTVGGVGGPDSQLVPLRLTPGEIVNVKKGGQQEQRAPNIIINNNAPQAQVSAGVGANGFDINVVIDDAFANNASRRGTKTFAALNNLGTPLSRG